MKLNSTADANIPDVPCLDSNTFKCIYETYYKKVYNYINYRINNHHNTEELVGDVFERVIDKYHTYRPNHSSLEAWIIGITKNIVVDYYRSMKKRNFVSIESIINLVSDKPQPEDIMVLNETIKDLITAMDILKVTERDVLSMKFATDLKNSEIAKIMGLSESNVGVIIHRAMKKLYSKLESDV